MSDEKEFIVRVRGTMTVNIWKDVRVKAEDEQEAIDEANDHSDRDGWKNDLIPQRITIDDVTSIEWEESGVIKEDEADVYE